MGYQGQRPWLVGRHADRVLHATLFQRVIDLRFGKGGVGTTPEFAIGQRALLVESPDGNVLWDRVSLIDQATIDLLNGIGRIAAIALSHPHYYTSMVEWSRAFGKVPVYVHEGDREWVQRKDPVIHFWSGSTRTIGGGLTFIRCGGHYPNLNPLSRVAVESIARAVAPFQYDRIYGAWWDRHIESGAQSAVARSLERYLQAIVTDDPEP